jgi:hypothetical protein
MIGRNETFSPAKKPELWGILMAADRH